MVTEARDFVDGEVIPGTRYRVLRLLGRGGMGSVYEVEHTELQKRFVLKALSPTLANRDDLVARLRNEWRALARLAHPSIVSVTDAGTTGDSVPFYVMEHLAGVTLAERLQRSGPMPLSPALELTSQLLDALSAAHTIGVIHRDIKPSNILLLEAGGIKLLDFGIAKVLEQETGVVTARGLRIGTPRYMSPEQARGEHVDGRTDLYAVGLVLFEVLSGRSPFEGIVDTEQLLRAQIDAPPPPLGPELSHAWSELDDFIQALLAKDPRQRPTSARAAAVRVKSLASEAKRRAAIDARPSSPGRPDSGSIHSGSVQSGAPTAVASQPYTPDGTLIDPHMATARPAGTNGRGGTLRMDRPRPGEDAPSRERAPDSSARSPKPDSLGMSPPTSIEPQSSTIPGQPPPDFLPYDGNTAHDPTLLPSRAESLAPPSDAPSAAPARAGDTERLDDKAAAPTRTAIRRIEGHATPPPVVPPTLADAVAESERPKRSGHLRTLIGVLGAFGALLLGGYLGLVISRPSESNVVEEQAAVPAVSLEPSEQHEPSRPPPNPATPLNPASGDAPPPTRPKGAASVSPAANSPAPVSKQPRPSNSGHKRSKSSVPKSAKPAQPQPALAEPAQSAKPARVKPAPPQPTQPAPVEPAPVEPAQPAHPAPQPSEAAPARSGPLRPGPRLPGSGLD